ncbi:hypothetical protein QTN25_003332 [Entamoeba marina]
MAQLANDANNFSLSSSSSSDSSDSDSLTPSEEYDDSSYEDDELKEYKEQIDELKKMFKEYVANNEQKLNELSENNKKLIEENNTLKRDQRILQERHIAMADAIAEARNAIEQTNTECEEVYIKYENEQKEHNNTIKELNRIKKDLINNTNNNQPFETLISLSLSIDEKKIVGVRLIENQSDEFDQVALQKNILEKKLINLQRNHRLEIDNITNQLNKSKTNLENVKDELTQLQKSNNDVLTEIKQLRMSEEQAKRNEALAHSNRINVEKQLNSQINELKMMVDDTKRKSFTTKYSAMNSEPQTTQQLEQTKFNKILVVPENLKKSDKNLVQKPSKHSKKTKTSKKQSTVNSQVPSLSTISSNISKRKIKDNFKTKHNEIKCLITDAINQQHLKGIDTNQSSLTGHYNDDINGVVPLINGVPIIHFDGTLMKVIKCSDFLVICSIRSNTTTITFVNTQNRRVTKQMTFEEIIIDVIKTTNNSLFVLLNNKVQAIYPETGSVEIQNAKAFCTSSTDLYILTQSNEIIQMSSSLQFISFSKIQPSHENVTSFYVNNKIVYIATTNTISSFNTITKECKSICIPNSIVVLNNEKLWIVNEKVISIYDLELNKVKEIKMKEQIVKIQPYTTLIVIKDCNGDIILINSYKMNIIDVIHHSKTITEFELGLQNETTYIYHGSNDNGIYAIDIKYKKHSIVKGIGKCELCGSKGYCYKCSECGGICMDMNCFNSLSGNILKNSICPSKQEIHNTKDA